VSYSYLSAIIGSTRIARRAGRKAAIKPIAIIIAAATTIGRRLAAGRSGIRPAATFSTERKGCPDGETRANYPQPVVQCHEHHIASRRTQRHAHTDLVCAPRHRVPVPRGHILDLMYVVQGTLKSTQAHQINQLGAATFRGAEQSCAFLCHTRVQKTGFGKGVDAAGYGTPRHGALSGSR